MPRIERRIVALGARLRAGLSVLPSVRVHDLGARKCGLVTFSVDSYTATDAMTALIARGFKVNITKPAFPLLDMQRRGLPDLVRASVHYYNTTEEIDAFCDAVAALQSVSR